MQIKRFSFSPHLARLLACGSIAVFVVPGHGLAQPHPFPSPELPVGLRSTVRPEPTRSFIRNATGLLDRPVENQAGESFGPIADLALDGASGRLEFLTIGPGPNLKALPPQALEPISQVRPLTVAISNERWRTAPVVRREDLPAFAKEGGLRAMHAFYGTERPVARSNARHPRFQDPLDFGAPDPTTKSWKRPALHDPRLHLTSRSEKATPTPNGSARARTFGAPPPRTAVTTEGALHLHWASDLLGGSVTDRHGEPAGEVADFILDLRSGRVRHIILAHNGEQFAVPMRMTDIGTDGTVAIRTSVAALERAPRYDPRQARMRPEQAFLFSRIPEPEFGAPVRRSAGVPPNVGPDRAPEVRREARDGPARVVE